MLWDSDKAIQEHTATHVYNTIYDQGSFTPIARMVWLKDGLQQAANDDSDNVASSHDGNSIQVYHYHNDQLGTPNELTNEQGEVVWLADYEAWGETRREMCWGHILASQDESYARVEGKEVWHDQKINPLQIEKEHLQPIRFQGQVYDEETGLHYNRFRYYDADLGMFTTRDLIGLYGGLNVFAYAPNPTGWVDPLGLISREQAEAAVRADPSVKPFLPAKPRQGYNPARAAVYNNEQINKKWHEMVENDTAKHIKAGRMPACPPSPPSICTGCDMGSGGWKQYGGDTKIYHCGFDGYLENRIPSKSNPSPANECFYDNSGKLVDEKHTWSGCRGTPDYFPFYGTAYPSDLARGVDHLSYKEPGGPKGPSLTHTNIGEEAAAASIEYYKKHPN